MKPRLAVVVSHPIQHFAPWHRELARRGELDLRVFFCCDWGVEKFDDPDFGRAFKWDVPLTEGYQHEFLPIARRPQRLGFWETDNPAIAGALERFQPDVIKVFGYTHRTHWRATSWARRNRRPVMLYSDATAKRKRPWWIQLAKEVIVRGFYRRVDGAFTVGDNNRDYHAYYGIPLERLFPGMLPVDRKRLLAAVPDATAARRVVRERHGIPEEAFVVAFCGKFIPRKRALDLVEAVAGMRDERRPVWALLIGEGPQRGEIEAARERLGAARVALTGFVNQSAIPEHLVACDATAVTSSDDPHPLVVTESACFGLPVVASDAIGCVGEHDTARDDVNALVYPCGDVGALRRAIERLRDDERLRSRLSSAALEIARSQDVDAAAEALEDATRKLRELGPR